MPDSASSSDFPPFLLSSLLCLLFLSYPLRYFHSLSSGRLPPPPLPHLFLSFLFPVLASPNTFLNLFPSSLLLPVFSLPLSSFLSSLQVTLFPLIVILLYFYYSLPSTTSLALTHLPPHSPSTLLHRLTHLTVPAASPRHPRHPSFPLRRTAASWVLVTQVGRRRRCLLRVLEEAGGM